MIGVDSFTARPCRGGGEPDEVRIRVAGRTDSLRRSAMRIGNEVETLYTNGPAGGGGVWKSAREIVAVASTLIPAAAARRAVPQPKRIQVLYREPPRGLMKLREIAHARTGDKGDTSNISVIAFDRRLRFPRRARHRRTRQAHFAGIVRGEVTRYELPKIGALNFVLTKRSAAASRDRSRSTPTARD